MSGRKPSYEELETRLERAEAVLDSLRRGEFDLIIGLREPIVVQFKSLAEEKERLAREWQTTFDAVGDAIWLLDGDQRILRTNRAAEKFFQRPADALIGRHCWEISHGTPRPIPECPLLRLRRSLRREQTEMPVGDRLLYVTVDPILDAGGKLTGSVHVVSDITERKRAEERIRRSEETYRNLFCNAQVGLFRTRISDGKILESNEQLARMFGYDTREEFIAEYATLQNYVDAGTREKMLERIRRAGSIEDFEARFYRKDRSIFWARYSARIDPEQGWIEGVAEDITEQKLTEETLKIQLRILSSFHTIPDEEIFDEVLKVILDVMHSPSGLFGYLDGALVVPTMTYQMWDSCRIADKKTVFPPAQWGDSSWGRAIREKKANYSNDPSTKTPAGHIPVARHINMPVLFRDEVIGLLTLANSETEYTEADVRRLEAIADQVAPLLSARLQRVRAEKEKDRLRTELAQAQKLESVGRLAGGVAHDFNNMLGIILGYGDILMQKLHPGDPLRDDVKKIVEAGKRSASLTRRLLAFSRKQTLQPEVLNLNSVLRNLEKMLRRLIGEDIDLKLTLADDLAHVLIDPGQFDQVIMNLAVNARDAMPTGGKLTIETANVAIEEQIQTAVPPGQYVMISVTDSGCGMDETVLPHIFEPFFTTKEKEKGTGLGLSTVYGIVKQSGGHIRAYSGPGQGSTFKIFLPPTHVKPQVEKISLQERRQIGGGKRVLVVEDEESMRELLRTILSRLGFEVFVAANGGEALLRVEEQGLEPDLVLTDVVMPGMSGAVLAERLRRSQPDLKVLFMSGYTDDAIVHHRMSDHGTPFIQKPFSIDDIAEKIRRVLQNG
ncbi:MAG TPA: response regulator [Syntrophobacteraceae bacterium]|nr:response regulator [Syntrophobacteraceae bacterium]